jgi:hypothetical protein
MGAAAYLILAAGSVHADIFNGTLYYTHFTGAGPNVLKTTFTYNDSTQSLTFGPQQGIATVNGADGIMFVPNGNLVVTSNSANNVYRIDATNGNLLQTVHDTNPVDFHMALDPSGTKFYSSDRYTQTNGPLDTFAINSNGTFNNAVGHAITFPSGAASNVTQLAFAPNGKILYTDGSPNAFGSIGLFNLAAYQTTQLIAVNTVKAAHGVIYDPFTKLWTMFGGGSVATMDPNAGSNAAITASLKQRATGVSDFDQGAVDGFGHALIAGAGGITFIDYSKTGDITNPADFVKFVPGFGNIDDVAPLVGLGAPPVPEPSSFAIVTLASAIFGAGAYLRRRRAAA